MFCKEYCFGVFTKLILVHNKQCTYFTKLLLPQGNWIYDSSPLQQFPPCKKELWESNGTLLWRRCTGIIPLKYNTTVTSQYILGWSGNQEDYSDSYLLSIAESWDPGLSAGILYSSTKFPQTYVWKLAASTGKAAGQSSPSKPVCPLKGTLLAWFKMLYVLLVGEIKVSMNGIVFDVSFPDCILTNCVSQVDDHTHVLVLKQPSFVTLPVHGNDPWIDDKNLQVTE